MRPASAGPRCLPRPWRSGRRPQWGPQHRNQGRAGLWSSLRGLRSCRLQSAEQSPRSAPRSGPIGQGLSRYRVGTKSSDGAAEAPGTGPRRLPAASALAGLPGGRGQEVRRGPGRPAGRPAGLLRVLLAVPAAPGGGDRALVRASRPGRPERAGGRLDPGPVPGHRRPDPRRGPEQPAAGQRSGPGGRAGPDPVGRAGGGRGRPGGHERHLERAPPPLPEFPPAAPARPGLAGHPGRRAAAGQSGLGVRGRRRHRLVGAGRGGRLHRGQHAAVPGRVPGAHGPQRAAAAAAARGGAWRARLGAAAVARQLSRASATYGTFALVIGLLSWLYLASTVTLLAAELNVVRSRRLWPRSLAPPPLGQPDERALEGLAKQEERLPDQRVEVTFESAEGTEAPRRDETG